VSRTSPTSLTTGCPRSWTTNPPSTRHDRR
jgi:hypothetical protein